MKTGIRTLMITTAVGCLVMGSQAMASVTNIDLYADTDNTGDGDVVISSNGPDAYTAGSAGIFDNNGTAYIRANSAIGLAAPTVNINTGVSTTTNIGRTGGTNNIAGTTNINTSGNGSTNIGGGSSINTITGATNNISGATNINTSGGASTSIGSTNSVNSVYGLTNTITATGVGSSNNIIGTTNVTGPTTVVGATSVTGATNINTTGAAATTIGNNTLTAGNVAAVSGNASLSLVNNAGASTASLSASNGTLTNGILAGQTSTVVSGGTTRGGMLTLNDNGATFANTTTGAPIRVHGVADGVNAYDAVNVRQLRGVYAGVAGAAAMANIPAVEPGKRFALGAAVGGFKGQGALAVGATLRVSDNAQIRASVSSSTNNDSGSRNTAYAIGAGLSF